MSGGRCAGTWLSPRSGQPLYCAREVDHVGACRDVAGWWRDEDERNAASTMARIREAAEIRSTDP